MPVNSALIKQNLFYKIGYQNEDLKSLEDWEFWLRCAFGGATFNFIKDEEAYALVRIHTNSMSQKKYEMLKWQIQIRTLIQISIYNSQIKPELREKLNRLNSMHKKTLQKELVVKFGLLNFNVLKEIYVDYGFGGFLKIYFSCINIKRKQKKINN